MSYYSNALKLKAEIDNHKKVAETVEAAGGIKVTRTQSDKLGFDWDNYYVNDILVKQVYVEREIAVGTAENPIVWKETMQLITNAFYIHDEVRKVWTGETGESALWTDERWEVF